MKTFPTDKKTREELFGLLGVQGGTCHQLPELMLVHADNGVVTTISTRTHFIVIPHEPVQPNVPKIQVYRSYAHLENGKFCGSPKTIGLGYVDWSANIRVSPELEKWLVSYAAN